ncbi:hypothetical protein F4781DRAFT_414981 [Annulohypoxylon bovei var. microspora]|nr:hypothetical protein F4781DRAFT_414981 [Annulohypoxylon bovei var. microspora]
MPPRKRTAAEAASSTPQAGGSSRRRSGRIGSSGRKSTYFETNDDDDADELSGLPPRKALKTQARAKKGRKEESDDELLYEEDKSESEDDDGDDGDGFVENQEESDDNSESEEAPPPVAQKRGRGRPSKTPTKAAPPVAAKKSNAKSRVSGTGAAAGRAKAQSKAKSKVKAKAKAESEDPEAGDDDDDDDDEDEDNRITFIPAVRLRDTDGIDYEDERVHKNTFLFLKDLKVNNNRSWLKANDREYRRSLKDWESFVETLTEKIIEVDDTIPELPVKDVVFRIYRDVRFSKDQTPYKPHYSAAWSRTGRKGPYAAYYVHAEPGRCMIGGGIWHPDADSLALLRASVDNRPHRIRRVLMNPAFRKTFLPGVKANEKAVLAAFAAKNQENALKTKPKGFHPEHRDIEILKLRNYTIGTEIDEADLTAQDAQDRVMKAISAMSEFISFLNSVVRPDPNVDSDSDEAEGGAEEEKEGESEGDDDEE